MVAGDVNKDGLIDARDVQAIRDSAAMSNSPRFSLRGYGVAANGIDRTIVDNNLGKVSSLRNLSGISADLGINADDSENGGIIGPPIDANAINAEIDRINEEFNARKSAKIAETFVAGIDYLVTAKTTIEQDRYVDVDIFIQNIGDDWNMANCSFPIRYDPTVVAFEGLVPNKISNVQFTNSV